MVWHALMDVMVSMTSSMQCSWHCGVSSAPGGLHDCSAHLFLPLLPFLLTGFWSATHIYICFVLSVQSVETKSFFQIYTPLSMNIFLAGIIICIQSDYVAACIFYFEFIQIFIFSLHSMAVHVS